MSGRSTTKTMLPTFDVRKRPCSTCIYRKDSSLDLKALETEIADRFGGFVGHRICHHSVNVCCRGFWNRHKDEFQMGQVAQRLDRVRFVDVDDLPRPGNVASAAVRSG